MADLERHTYSRLTFDGRAAEPAWSPDGRWVAYYGGDGIYRRRADGSGQAVRVWTYGQPIPSSFSPDGRFLLADTSPSRGQNDLWLVPLDAPATARVLVQSPSAEGQGVVSPDGRWVAYMSNMSGRPEVYVSSFPAAAEKWQISNNTGFEPRWSRDGREIFYRDGNGNLFALPVEPGDSFAVGPPVRLFGGMRTGDNNKTYGVRPDGTFVTLSLAVEKAVDRVNLVLGWDREVARLLAPPR